MNPRRWGWLLFGCLLAVGPLFGQGPPTPFGMDKQFSADMVITTDKGETMTKKIYSDNGKVRTEMNMQGMQTVSIIRPDQQTVYQVMVAQKMVMKMPYDPEKYQKQMAAVTGPQGKFELVGPDMAEGVACTKYKMTSDDGKVFFYWINAATKAPVKMAAEDGSFSIVWKNYQAGPQDPALFEPPADYQVMAMPAMPMPGGGGQ